MTAEGWPVIAMTLLLVAGLACWSRATARPSRGDRATTPGSRLAWRVAGTVLCTAATAILFRPG
jgi:hypothetical protein